MLGLTLVFRWPDLESLTTKSSINFLLPVLAVIDTLAYALESVPIALCASLLCHCTHQFSLTQYLAYS